VVSYPELATSYPIFSSMVWLRDGRLIFARYDPGFMAGNLHQIPVDPTTGTPAGEPAKITNWHEEAPICPSATADGSRVTVDKVRSWTDVYFADLKEKAGSGVSTNRLTLSRSADFFTGWTRDGGSILFQSDRTGRDQIFRQQLGRNVAELLIQSSDDEESGQLSPDEQWILYWAEAHVSPSLSTKTLQKAGLIQKRASTDLSAQNKEVGDLYVAHTLLISRVRTMITAACARHPELSLLTWREGKGIQDTIEVALPTPYAKLPVAADSFFSVQDAQGRTHYFLEADRGTMTRERFTRKLIAYAAYDKAQRHKAKFGIRKFRVLTVTTGETRMQNLMRAACKAEEVRRAPASMFLFTTEEKLALSRPETIFEKIWLRLGEKEPSSLGFVRKSPMEGESTMQQHPNAQTEVRHGP
jgi:protein involved in plasmid replication-relaxation